MKRTAVVALATAALLVAGCGDTAEKNDYVKKVNAINADLTRSISELASKPSSSRAQSARTVNNLADSIEASADKLDALDPPDSAKSGHAKLAEGTHKIADEVRSYADEAGQGDTAALQKASATLTDGAGAREIQEGFKELTDAGIKQQK